MARSIETYAKRFGYGVVRDFTGHGVGEAFHSGLIIPHYDAAPTYNTLNVNTFLKAIQVINYDKAALGEVAAHVINLANAEDLPAHGDAVAVRNAQ